MPVAATGLADVGATDLDPLEVLRCGDHPAQELAISRLDPGSLLELQPGVGDPFRQLVAQPLQLTEVEDPRLSRDRGNAVIELDPAEGRCEETAQLTLEAADLAPQLGPRPQLVDLDAKSI